jgi:hypothetical protein
MTVEVVGWPLLQYGGETDSKRNAKELITVWRFITFEHTMYDLMA